MLTVRFFAQIRELIGIGQLEINADYTTVEQLRQALILQGDKWQLALTAEKLLAAVNQHIVTYEHPLQPGDEIAFFPPVTGG